MTIDHLDTMTSEQRLHMIQEDVSLWAQNQYASAREVDSGSPVDTVSAVTPKREDKNR